ncbi:hypothetical protein [Anaerovibrio lipolyticus]|uniref:hypothetical protein n=1 Tax=Anaerovibrio lipolyticus TaxID=82374 RepID=UPI0026EE7419|nr:hypothetical protein [Anaerovibrio lipolyticus]MBE6105326.1 hypothetical protein [Anaerovibrio lipolyticus]
MSMYCLPIKIKTLAPVVLSAKRSTLMTSSINTIPGAVMRGILVEQYLNQNTNISRENAHLSSDFQELFFGDLSFVPAFPNKEDAESFVLPLSLQISKSGAKINDMLKNTDPDSAEGFKTKRGIGFITDDIKLCSVSVDKNIRLHINRMTQDGESDKNRLAGSSQDGRVFSYEAIDANQVFTGGVYGEKAKLEKISAALAEDSWICYVGKSKFTQYGKCWLSLGNIKKVELKSQNRDKSICLLLSTPLVMADNICDAKESLEEVFGALGDDITIDNIYGAAEEVAGFNSKWNMRRPSRQALAAGTVFRLTKETGWDDSSWSQLEKMCYTGVGLYCEDGYGQLRLWDTTRDLVPEDNHNEKVSSLEIEIINNEVQRVAKLILTKRMRELVELRAYNDVQIDKGNENVFAGKAHALARLEKILGPRNKLEEIVSSFTSRIKAELDAENSNNKIKPLAKNLKAIRIGGKELFDILQNPYLVPSKEAQGYIPDEWHDFVKETNIPVNMENGSLKLDDKEICGGLFYDYWLAFIRHARKQASLKEG